MNIAYVRVSTIEQNEERQVKALKPHNIDKWYIEKVSGKDTNRPKLIELLDFIREGDTLFVHDFSRLSRSTKDLLELVDLLEKKNVRLVSNKENLDTHTPTGKLMLTMIAAINEFERNNMLERQKEGIAVAKVNGKYSNNHGHEKQIDDETWVKWQKKYLQGLITKQEMAAELNISRPTLNKRLKEKGLD